MKQFKRFIIAFVAALFMSSCGEPDFVQHEDLPPNMKKVYLFVRDSDTKKQIEGAEIKFLNAQGQAIFEATSKPDKPWDFFGTRTKDIDFMIHGKLVEIKKNGYADFSMNFEDIPSVEKAKNSFEVYATLQKQ
jgi:hypothetical protein